MCASNRHELELHLERLDTWVDVGRVIDVVARECDPAVLDSADGHVAGPRYAVVACRPAYVLAARHPIDPDPFEALANVVRSIDLERTGDVPFAPGWIGYFGYEAGRWLEELPATTRREIDLPDVRLALYDTLAVADLQAETWSIVSVDLPAALVGPRPAACERAAYMAALIRSASDTRPSTDDARDDGMLPRERVASDANQTPFVKAVGRAKAYIEAGDVFQVNLCHHVRAVQRCEPSGLYQRLRKTNPAHYGAYLAFENRAILSASPELFLMLRGRDVVTRPIKGTRPRTGLPEVDAIYRQMLARSEKDHAELAMIVDLERNDLGRVCAFGSIRVVNPWTLETHPTVYHLVSTIGGRLRPECDAIDLLRAAFPSGSITGAPKIRAMQIIDELESTNRSVYCGAIGHIGLDGDLTMNVAIRTILADGRTLHVPVGSGIVADSVPEDEFDETLAKGAGLLAALTLARPRYEASPGVTHHEVCS